MIKHRCIFEYRKVWLQTAKDCLGIAARSNTGVLDPVDMAQIYLQACRDMHYLAFPAAVMQMALDFNPEARLALCRAFDLLTERTPR